MALMDFLYGYSQYKYSEGAIVYTCLEDGIFLAMCDEVNSEASTYAETATITTDGTVLYSNDYYADYNTATLEKRNMALAVYVIQASAGDTITMSNSQTRNYQTQGCAVFKLGFTATEVTQSYFRSSTDNSGISTSDTLTLSDLPAGVYFAFIQESRKEASAATTLTLNTAVDDSTVISPLSLSGDAYVSISAAMFYISDTTTIELYSTNSGGSSYASKIYGVYKLADSIVSGYTVQFNSNGGSGTMSDQFITEGVATPLTANTFTKDGCRFDGWALTSDGAAVYNDAQIVTDIADPGDTLVLYAVWTVIAYSIDFNANGGSGSMSTQYINVGTATALSANTFTREGYTFSGWALSASGSVVYADGETVEDLGDAGDVIDLYAVWEKTPIYGILFRNKSPKNMLAKDLTELYRVNIIFKDATNIIDPVFMFSGVQTEIIAACNYIYVPDLGRYYFVNKIETLRAGVWLLYCHVDVLMSYADEIKTQYAIVKRQEKNYNMYINDGVFKVYQYSNIETFPFSSGFSTIEYVLMVAGN